MRLEQGREEKARRGELARLLPPGYVYDSSGQVVKDPDRRVREAMALVFEVFRRTGSIRQTFMWFRHEGIELPVNKIRGGKWQLVWQPPSVVQIAGRKVSGVGRSNEGDTLSRIHDWREGAPGGGVPRGQCTPGAPARPRPLARPRGRRGLQR